MNQITFPSHNSRAVFVGKTGCGKTTLAEKICANHSAVVVLDSKGELFWDGYEVHTNLTNARKSKHSHIIWQPNIHEQNEPTYDEFFKWLYDKRNVVVYIDEVLAICKNSQNMPFHYRAILTRGRSRNVGCYNSTQAPVFVPHWILSQSEHYFVFQMRLETDREKVEKITGIPRKDLKSLTDHQFFYADDNDYFPRKIKLMGV